MKIKFFSLLFTIMNYVVLGQDYSAIDAHAKSIKYSRDIAKLTEKLVAPYQDDESKVRAIFVWIASNIEYDHKKLEKMEKSGFKRTRFKGSKDEIKAQRLAQIQEYIDDTLDDKKGVCQDFSWLFQAMCLHAGIECEFITGAGKTRPTLIGQANIPARHAWNAVKMNGKWSLIDVTWSTGMGEKEDFGNGFFNLDPKTMIMSHFPNEEEWQLLDSVYSKTTFANLPYLYSGFIKYGVSDITPFSGKVTKKDSIGLKIKLPKGSKLVISKNKKNADVPVIFDGERYYFGFSKKTLSGNIDVCILSSEGRVEPLYALSMGVGSSK
jgi:transglutaminase/protease-like cytokinesis protein 3